MRSAPGSLGTADAVPQASYADPTGTGELATDLLSRSPLQAHMGYEQLLTIQQHQHALALQQKDAEMLHMKACMDVLEAESATGDKRLLAEAVRSKDEESAVMMAAKHKELELMAGLLHLREQQIEEFRQVCEAQQGELAQLRRRRGAAEGSRREGTPSRPSRVGELAPSPTDSLALRRSPGSAEEHAQLEREVRRLRLKMEEMESAIADQHERSAGLAQALQVKMDHVRALEAQVLLLQASPPAAPAQPSPGRAAPGGLGPCSEVGAGMASWYRDATAGTASSLRSAPTGQDLGGSTSAGGHRASVTMSDHGHASFLPAQATDGVAPCPADQTDASQGPALADAAASHPLPSYRSAVFVEHASGAASPSADGGGAAGGGSAFFTAAHSEAAETGRQSQELLREMRRLRLQMGELERAAAVPPSHQRLEQRDTAAAKELLPPGSGAAWSLSRGPATLAAREPVAAPGNGAPWTVPQPGPSSGLLAPLGSSAPGCAGGEAGLVQAPLTDFPGWEYRPHASGDPTDAAVAALVNMPHGRYRGWRALLCRLEQGVYLCGTRRVRLRADAAAGVIEAFEDGSETWSDLSDLMRGPEASQHALLERARGALAGPPPSQHAAPSGSWLL